MCAVRERVTGGGGGAGGVHSWGGWHWVCAVRGRVAVGVCS